MEAIPESPQDQRALHLYGDGSSRAKGILQTKNGSYGIKKLETRSVFNIPLATWITVAIFLTIIAISTIALLHNIIF